MYSFLKEYTPCAASVIILGSDRLLISGRGAMADGTPARVKHNGILANARLVQPVSNARARTP